MAEKKKVNIVIIGAGMAGITAANKLLSSSSDLFHISILEAGHRIGGRIHSSEFCGHRVELGATWIHGIEGSPIHGIAKSIGALDPDPKIPSELMDGFPLDNFVTLREGGTTVDPSVLDRMSSLCKDLKARASLACGTHESLGSYLRSGLLPDGASDVERGVFAIYGNIERTCTSADDLDELSLLNEVEYKEFPGEHVAIAGGYSRVVESLSGEFPAGLVRFGCRASRIEWSRDAGGSRVRVHVEGGEVVDADHVIVTVSLGVLKSGGVVFSPALPGDKAAAIGRLGFGVMDKLFVEVNSTSSFPRLLLAFESDKKTTDVPWWMRRTAGILPIYAGARVLHVFLAGKEAVEMEAMEEEEEVIGGVQATIDAFLPCVEGTGRVTVVGMKRSGWARDPLFLGSYSYLAVGSTGEDLDLMAEPVPGKKYGEKEKVEALQILFAGEATHRSYFSTTHGAYFSGIREAERLLELYAPKDNVGF